MELAGGLLTSDIASWFEDRTPTDCIDDHDDDDDDGGADDADHDVKTIWQWWLQDSCYDTVSGWV